MASLFQKIGFLKKPVDPAVQAKEWQRKIKREVRTTDREIQQMQREEDKFIKEVKKTAKLGTRGGTAVHTLAKNVVMARKAKERLYMQRAQLNSVGMTLAHNIASIKLSKCMSKSADVMKAMNDVINLPKLNVEMREMAREMEKAGLIEELIGDAIDDAVGGEELEEAASHEVNKVLEELAIGTFSAESEVATKSLPAAAPAEEVQDQVADEEEDEMRARLQAL
ncbi:hypothetical protein ScalyP_jg8556 [Parmales sp. scaly parma]|jgi:charged multivesicular body protein 3|nr:hypothetical protein ScalyP_jg8556 [Parmales sp. scaly parma]